ncbi:hypothetical protein L1049_013365 [Liquidambar formosana]|uniref:Uncharacterized protein n=1 Tax=Liquidambar formosana TaxID=63359 RepID=A0AAP0WYA2_LIQFO
MAEAVADVEELPKAIVRRVVKDKLSQLSDDGDISVHKDALLAFSESAQFREKNAGKRAGAAKAREANKKRKVEETPVENGGGEGKQDHEDEGDEEED